MNVAQQTGRALEVANASRRFGAVVALDEVSVTVDEGEILALLGPSGCGKTTLLRCIAGLETLDQGTVSIRGRDVSRLMPAHRRVAMVFQDGALFPHLTVRENVAVGAAAHGKRWRDAVRSSRVETVLRTARLDNLDRRYPHQLSGGQRQRVGIARALAAEPDLMLMDEPFANLDADLRLDLRRDLRRLHQEGVVAETVFVTHDQTEALGVADRITVMFDGAIAQTGTPSELLARPHTLTVARFLGVPRINILPEHNGVVLAVRPSDLSAQPLSDQLTAAGIVMAAEPFAGGWLTTLAVHGTELELLIDGESAPPVAIQLTAGVDQARIHCFDAANGKKIDLSFGDLAACWKAVLGEAEL